MEMIFFPYFYPILLCLKWFQCYILDTIMYILLRRTSCEGKADVSSKGKWMFQVSHSQHTKRIDYNIHQTFILRQVSIPSIEFRYQQMIFLHSKV